MSLNITQKRCTVCGEIKSIDDFYGRKKKNGRSGLYYSGECKICHNKDCQARWTRNIDRNNKRNHRYYQENKERIKKRVKKYKSENKDKIKSYPSRNKEYVSAYNSEYNSTHREECTKRQGRYRKKHPEKLSQFNRNRLAYKRAGKGRITSDEWTGLLEQYNYTCLSCLRTYVKLTLDHVIPLSAGGSNTIQNAQPLCRSCNSKKGTKTIDYRPAFLKNMVVNRCSNH